MAKSIKIGNKKFPSKKAAKDDVRNIIDRYDPDSDLLGNDLSFINDLLTNHPESEQKIGCGISRIYVRISPQNKKNKAFFLERNDGTSTDFSWIACIDGDNQRKEVFDAFRNAVACQIKNFKLHKLQTDQICPYTDEKLHKDNTHVDHQAPFTFKVLVENFLNNECMKFLDVAITEPEDNQFTTYLTNKNFSRRWEQFHKKNAKLRLISKKGNLSYAKKNTTTS